MAGTAGWGQHHPRGASFSDAYSQSGSPFVMNSQAEIAKAIRDFNSGKLGRMG